MVPHVTNQIKKRIFLAAEGADVAIIEIGGTVGDIESLPYLETIRQIAMSLVKRCVPPFDVGALFKLCKRVKN